jgi:undecaprenyl-diphosphatase
MPGSEYWEAILLGVIQGIAEFLPVSSSGHLVIVTELLHGLTGRKVDPESSLQLNVALHLGTLFSILVVYRRDLLRVLQNFRLCVAISLATVPLVLVVLVAHDFVETTLQTPWAAGIGLFVTAGLLIMAHRAQPGEGKAETMSWPSVAVVSLSQALAIVPGISRSGSTISSGLMCGLRREEASRFSFLIAIPAIAGAVVWTGVKIFRGEGGGHSIDVLLIGAVVAFLVGLLALRWLIRIVTAGRLHWFAWYCAVVGSLTVIWQAVVTFQS